MGHFVQYKLQYQYISHKWSIKGKRTSFISSGSLEKDLGCAMNGLPSVIKLDVFITIEACQ